MALPIITQRPAVNVQAPQVLILRTMTDVWHGPAEIIAETERLVFSD
jgi:hypothetical protein